MSMGWARSHWSGARDAAFQSFFRRVKAGQAPGFPRFRPLSRCVTIDLTKISGGTVKPRGGHYELQVKGFPRIRLHGSRELPDAVAKSVRLTKRGRHWEASLVYAVERAGLPASVEAVGIDLGVRKRMTLSNGKRYQRATRDWQRQRRLQRAVARCRKGSQRRRKRVQALARLQRREFVRERNACHRATTEIIRDYGLVAVERLQVAKMTRSARGTEEQPGKNVAAKAGLNREILSQNWSLLRRQLEQKAEWAGREYVEVDPKHFTGLQLPRAEQPARRGDIPLPRLRTGGGSRRQCCDQHFGCVNVGRWAVRRSRIVCEGCMTLLSYIRLD